MAERQPESLFQEWHGTIESGFPILDAPVQRTTQNIPYLQVPGVALLAKPQVHPTSIQGFLAGFDEGLEFNAYLNDPTKLPDSSQLAKIAGQLCYMSFGPKRSMNEKAARYFDNLKSSGHGSVLEHANFSLFFYGVSRSLTHELIRHRAGFGFSQVSQRYVSGQMLRFVERPEFAADPVLHQLFLERIDRSAAEYAAHAERLLALQEEGSTIMSAEVKRDLRKKVQQSARAVLPNETEAPIVVTGNARAWRHFLEMRASAHAETEIRALAVRAFLCLRLADPILFGDYQLQALPDGTYAVATDFQKV